MVQTGRATYRSDRKGMLHQRQRQSGTRACASCVLSIAHMWSKAFSTRQIVPGAQYAESTRRNSLIINFAELLPSFHNLGAFVLVL